MQDVKYSRGFVRKDGMVYWGKGRGAPCVDRWLTNEKFLSYKQNEKRYLLESRERISANKAKWKRNNKDKMHGYYLKSSESVKARSAKWKRDNPSRVNEYCNRRRAIKTSTAFINEAEMIKSVYDYARRVSLCTGIQFHVDHIIPLSRGGSHSVENVQILPAKINLRKGVRTQEKVQITQAFPRK